MYGQERVKRHPHLRLITTTATTQNPWTLPVQVLSNIKKYGSYCNIYIYIWLAGDLKRGILFKLAIIGKVIKIGKLNKNHWKALTFIDQIHYFFFSKCPPRNAMDRSKRRSKFPMVRCSVAWVSQLRCFWSAPWFRRCSADLRQKPSASQTSIDKNRGG